MCQCTSFEISNERGGVSNLNWIECSQISSSVLFRFYSEGIPLSGIYGMVAKFCIAINDIAKELKISVWHQIAYLNDHQIF